MLLKDILEDIDLMVPNSFSADRKLRWVNQTQRQVYQDYPNLLTKKTFPLTIGTAAYAIPADCTQAGIESLQIGEWEYEFRSPDERPEYRTYTVYDGQMEIYPVPDTSMTATIYYKPVPIDLTTANLESEPTFPEDYHELLVLGASYRVAQRIQDYKIATEIEARFTVMAREAAKRNIKPKRKTTVIMRGWS